MRETRTIATSSSVTHPLSAAQRDERIGRALLFVLGAVFVCVIAVSAIARAPRSAYYIPFGFLLLIGIGLLCRGSRRTHAALMLVSVAPIPWVGEVALGRLHRAQQARELKARRNYAEHAGYTYDSRSGQEVVEDLRKQGLDAWPAVSPGTFQEGSQITLRGADGKELQPLGGVSSVETEFGNEDGRYLIYRSDEHGFHNPPGVWSLPSLDVAAVGDSFTQGASVPSDSNLVEMVRQRWPSTLNLGYSDNGPLTELASLLEYLPRRRPRVVLWVLCEANDLSWDLEREMKRPLLLEYLRQKRSFQNLEARQLEIDAALRGYVDRSFVLLVAPEYRYPALGFFEVVRLRETGRSWLIGPPRYRWSTFSEILQTARDTVRSWHGQIYLVYLPVHYCYFRNEQPRTSEEKHQHALEVARALAIPVIDVEQVFRDAGPQVTTFVYPYVAHFTALGYETAGRAVAKRLEADGF